MYNKTIPDIDRQLNIMSKFELTAEEYFFVYLLILATETNPSPVYLAKYFNECKKESIPRETLKSLQDKKILSSDYKVPEIGESFHVNKVKFSKTFLTNYFKLSFYAGQELMDAYPEFIQGSSSRSFPAKTITNKGFYDYESFFSKYGKLIGHDPKVHDEVMESLAWAKENELLQYGMAEYVIGRKWRDHIEIRKSGQIGKFMVKHDTLEDV